MHQSGVAKEKVKMINLKIIVIILSTLLAINSASYANYDDLDTVDLPWFFSQDFLDSDRNGEKLKELSTCETNECRQIAQEFLTSMNKSADPCEDFYEFTCGSWEAKKSIPKYAPQWSRMKIFEAAVHRRIRGILETEAKETDLLPVRQAKDWYRSCMNENTREMRGLEPIGSILMQTGGWPMTLSTEEWKEDEYSWQRIDEHLLEITGDSTFFKFKFLPWEKNQVFGRINIGAPDVPFGSQMPLRYRNYTGNDLVAYTSLIRQMAKAFISHNKANVSDNQLDEDINDLIRFEKTIYMISSGTTRNIFDRMPKKLNLSLEGFVNYFEDKITKKSSDSQVKIHWRLMIDEILGMANINANDSLVIEYVDFYYLYMLPKILKSTSLRTIVNYIHWKFVSDYMSFINNEARDMFFEFVKDEYGVEERIPRWQECVLQMGMSDAAAYVFVNNFYTNEKNEVVRKSLNAIKNSFKSQIEESNWMDDGSKACAEEKIDKMHLLLGFPDWYKNKTAFINHYQGLSIGNEYLDNILSFVRYKKKVELREFEGSDRNEAWLIDPITINALYVRNTIVIPAADFQSPLFGENVPDYVNYGTVGLFIGHEMAHGFDDKNIMSAVNLTAVLSSRDMMQMYYQRVSCFTKQYDEYFGTQAPELKQDRHISRGRKMSKGSQTKSENIADTTGLQAVLDAYKELLKMEKPNGELKLPGFEEFSNEQMFFISFGQMWCEISTPKFDQKREKDPHSPARLRVIGAVSNMKDFGRVFNCPLGSPMNPEDKCSIWTNPGAKLIPKKMAHGNINIDGWKQNWN